jgi:transketolase
MTVVVPCDAIEARKATMEAAKLKGPVYLRLGRSGVPVITTKDDFFKIGKANILRDGGDLSIFACGQMVSEALLAHEELAKEGIKSRVINMHTPKPIDSEAVIKAAKETGAIVTCEEHTVVGGFGSAIAEVVVGNWPIPVKMVGVKDRFGVSGEPGELFKYFGLTAADIVKAAKETIKMKKG